MKIPNILFVILLVVSGLAYADKDFGKSSTVNPDGRSMKLLEDFQYDDPNGMVWIASRDSVVDGASIPLIVPKAPIAPVVDRPSIPLIVPKALIGPIEPKEYFGKYYPIPVKTEWDPDGRSMKLLEDFHYEDPNGMVWIAPKGSKIDGASIPRIAWSVVGGPYSALYRDASIVHDVACREKRKTWEVVHLMFYYAMRASGVDEVLAKIMYTAVYFFGPRWPIVRKFVPSFHGLGKIPVPMGKIPVPTGREITINIPPDKKTLTPDQFFDLVEEIKKAENSKSPMSLEQIRQYK
jgi:hypothetical protein